MTEVRVRLLETPVLISCDDAALAQRVALVYDAMPRHSDDSGLQAKIRQEGEAFAISVDGRDPVTAPAAMDAVRTLNHELLHGVMLRERNRFYIHAAVVATERGGVILPGLSGAGKSTLALALLAKGAQFLSDELLVFDPEPRVIRAFPRAIKIRDVCVDYFPDLSSCFEGTGEGRFLALDHLGDNVVADAVPPIAIVAPTWAEDGDDLIQDRSPGQGLLALCASALNFGTHREASLDHLSALAFASRCAALQWQDPHQAAESILEWVR